jgi:hypothetical protein
MKHAAWLAALAMVAGAGWFAVSVVCGAEAGKVPPSVADRPSVAPAGKATATATASPVAAARAPATPIREVAPLATSTTKAGDVTPPAPMPNIDIPPIPAVGDDPFKPGPAPAHSAPSDVLAEGKRLFEREGQIDVDPIGRTMFVFNSGDKPMYLLENSWREYLEKITQQGVKKIRWRVSGEVTVYGGRNYLLVKNVVHVIPEEDIK